MRNNYSILNIAQHAYSYYKYKHAIQYTSLCHISPLMLVHQSVRGTDDSSMVYGLWVMVEGSTERVASCGVE